MTVTTIPAPPDDGVDLDNSTPAGRLIVLALTLVATAPPRSLQRPDPKPRVTVSRHVLEQLRTLLEDSYPGLIPLIRGYVTGADDADD